MQPIFAVGDVHGYLDQLHMALDTIEREGGKDAPIVFTGDFVDRGPDSKGVIELLMQGQAEGRPWVCIMGNHDRYLLRYLDFLAFQDRRTTRPLYYTDPPIGGDKTLESYGVDTDVRRWPEDIHADAHKAIPQAHLDWIAALPRLHETQDQIFVHAGCAPAWRCTIRKKAICCGSANPSSATPPIGAASWCTGTPPCKRPKPM